MPPPYIEVQITTSEELVEMLVGILTQLGFEAFWEDGPVLKCYMRSDRWTGAMLDEVQTTITRMHRSGSTPRPEVTVRTVQERNWNAEWEKTITPIHVTDHIVITPTWHEYSPAAGELVITIDPKMSFGTGYHETTRLVLRLMEKHIRNGSRLLDIGTGTGVLAIAGVKLGATSAVALDVDEWAYNNAVENVRLNRVDAHVRIVLGELPLASSERFDLIAANIQLNVIAPMLPELRNCLANGGIAILSGLLAADRDEILLRLAEHGFTVREEMRENEWMAVAAG